MLNEEFFRLVEMFNQDSYCSQILIKEALANQNKENEISSNMAGQENGLSGRIVVHLPGLHVLALYAEEFSLKKGKTHGSIVINELVQWFEGEWGEAYGSIDCQDILEDNPQNRLQRCPQIIFQTNEKIKEILTANGYDLSGDLED